MREDNGAPASGTGSREPSPTVSALPGFDPSRISRAASRLTVSGRRNLDALPVSGGWATVSEMKPAATGSGMDLLNVRYRGDDRLCEREWVRWGGEFGQKRGEGYQYRITPLGRAVRQFLRDSDGSPKGGDAHAAPFTTARAEGIAQPLSSTGEA